MNTCKCFLKTQFILFLESSLYSIYYIPYNLGQSIILSAAHVISDE